MTLEERLDELRNVDLEGMEGRALFVEQLAMAYNYQGKQDGNQSHAPLILNHILDSLADILNNAEETLRILPLPDRTHKNAQLWIRTEDRTVPPVIFYQHCPRWINTVKSSQERESGTDYSRNGNQISELEY